jgi:hypothetical protein
VGRNAKGGGGPMKKVAAVHSTKGKIELPVYIF